MNKFKQVFPLDHQMSLAGGLGSGSFLYRWGMLGLGTCVEGDQDGGHCIMRSKAPCVMVKWDPLVNRMTHDQKHAFFTTSLVGGNELGYIKHCWGVYEQNYNVSVKMI